MAASYTSFGNYLLLKQRSADGLGCLWRAGEMERLGFKRIVWLRKFDQVGLDRTAIAAESPLINQLSQTFRSSNVVRNSVCDTEGGVPYVAWDYIPAQPLDQLLARVTQEQFPVAIDNALLITEKLAAALSAALAVEVRGEPLVHGFLVPEMVLVGNDGEAIVAGFGLSRGLLANLDRVAVQEMAAPYLAPEVLATAGASRRSDVYSLGAILFQLLTGAPLPADPTARAAALASPMLACDEGPVPADVAAILQKALATRPEDRYASAADLKRELEKLLYGGAYSPTTFNLALFMDRLYRHEIEEEDRELQREKGLDVSPYYRAPRSGEDEAPPAPATAASSRTGLYVALAAVIVLLGVIAALVFTRQPAQMDQAVIQQLVQVEIAKLKEDEQKAAQALAEEQERSAELRRQLEAVQKPGAAAKPLSAEEQAKALELKQRLAEQEAEQRRKEEELRRIRQQQAEAAQKAQTQAAQGQAQRPPVVPPTVAPQPSATPDAVVLASNRPPAVTPVVTVPTAAAEVAEPVAVAPPATDAAPAIREGQLVDFTEVEVPPQVLVEERVLLPRAAAAARVTTGPAVVILKVLVNERGSVDDVQVMRGYPVQRLGIDEACMDAARKYRFRPAMKQGVKVKTWFTVTMRIDLSRNR